MITVAVGFIKWVVLPSLIFQLLMAPIVVCLVLLFSTRLFFVAIFLLRAVNSVISGDK
jgi:hypothetical protein